jgi:hypothetical protein
VWNFSISEMRHIKSNFGGTNDDPTLQATYNSHRLDTYGVPIRRAWSLDQLYNATGYTAYLNETTQNWTFNWAWWDNLTLINMLTGANSFMIDDPMGMPREPEYWMYKNGSITAWGNETASFFAGVQSHFADLKDNRSIDWFQYAYIYFIDEFEFFTPDNYTQPEYFAALKVFLLLLRTAAPQLKIMSTSPPSYTIRDLRPYVDIYCVIADQYN